MLTRCLLYSAPAHAEHGDPSLWSSWLALGHYTRRGSGHYLSRARSQAFFIHPRGRTEPRLELLATLRAFERAAREHPPSSTDPRCRFPARFALLVRYLGSGLAAPERCGAFERFRRRVAPRTVAVVFASNYVASPQSAFGHTLLKLSPASSATASDLLDIAVNFSADMQGVGGIEYVFTGPYARFDGYFSIMDYHVKVKEYGDSERRDLWSYELSLGTKERDMLVRHLWEIRGITFDYYFVTQNCSSLLLDLLEAAAPRLAGLRDRVGSVAYPVEMLRVLRGVPGLVARVRYRPSLDTELSARFEALDAEERAQWFRLIDAEPLPAGRRWRHRSLDTALAYLQLEHASAQARGTRSENGDWAAARAEALLGLMAGSPESPRAGAPRVFTPIAPDRGHPPAYFLWSAGMGRAGHAFSQWTIRPAYHDMLDPVAGTGLKGELELLTTQLRYSPTENRFQLRSLRVFRLSSFPAWSPVRRRLAWRASLTAERLELGRCPECVAAGADVAIGIAASVGHDHESIAYALAQGGAGAPLQAGAGTLEGSLGALAGARLALSGNMSAVLELQYRYLVAAFPASRISVFSALRKVWLPFGLQLSVHASSDRVELAAGSMIYF